MQILFLCYHVWLPTLKKKVVGVLDSFFSFSNKYERKSHMFFLLLDPRVKTLYLVSSLVGHEQGKAIVEEYDSF
jgi:hypothetical protein